MTHHARIHFLVKDLLDELQSERFELGTGAYLRIQELLRQLPETLTDEELLLAITPVLARNPQEQSLVYEKFEQCRRRADALFGAPEPPPPPSEPGPLDRKVLRSKIWFWSIAAVLSLLLGIIAWIWLKPEETNVLEKSIAVTAGQTTLICPEDIPELDTFKQEQVRWVLTYPVVQPVSDLFPYLKERTSSSGATSSENRPSYGTYTIQNDTCLSYAARDSVQGMDSLVLRVDFRNGKNCELRLRLFIAPPVVLPPPEKPDTNALALQPRPYPHDHTQAFLDLILPSPDPWKARLAEHWPWLRWVIFGLFTILMIAYWRWRDWDKRKLIAELDRPDKPPYFWNIRIKDPDGIVPGDAFRHALQVMRRRSATDHLKLDLPRTIRATAEKGGLPAFRYRADTQPVDYLMLIDRQTAQNHRAQLFNAVFKSLQEQELHIERFFFDSDIRVLFNEAHPDGIRLNDLAQRYAQARLMVVGTGVQLFHPVTGQIESWAQVFKNWSARVLFTPKPQDDWTRSERRLAELFTVLPATLQSLGFWVEEAEQGDDARFERWRERVQDAPAAVYQPNDQQPLPMLLMQYPVAQLRWIAACAVYPKLHWDLTLWLGRRLAEWFPADGPLVTLENLLRIFRIRWFVQGQMPQSARAALLEWLEQEDPTLIPHLRRELALLLASSPPPEDSVAWADHRMAVVLNQWLSETDAQKKKALEKEIEQLLPKAEADFTVLKYLNRPPSPLHFPVPDKWKKYVYRGGFRPLGFLPSFHTSLIAGLLWLAGTLALFWWQPETPDDGCRGQKVEYILDGKSETLCLDSAHDSLLYQERLLLDAAESRNFALIDSLSNQDFPESASMDLAIEGLQNILVASFNAGAFYSSRGQRDTACLWFNMIEGQDSQIAQLPIREDFAKAHNWCLKGMAEDFANSNPEPSPVPEGKCYKVANIGTAIGFRNRVLSRSELRSIENNPNGPLARETLIQALKAGQTVTVLDSTADFWKVRVGVNTGYIAKTARNKPTLLPCQAVIRTQVNPSVTPPVTQPVAIPIPEMVSVKGGTFTMGCTEEQGEDCGSDEKPPHLVTLSDFEIGKTEVTIAQYLAFCDETNTHYPEWLEPGNDYHIETGSDDYYKKMGMSRANGNYPVTGVSWLDAVAYCQWLSAKTGKKFRLPTEAEWEYAARGGQKKTGEFKYAGSNSLYDVGWYTENTNDSGVRAVAGKKPNDLGLYDLSGNVWEWCSDWYGDYEDTGKPVQNPRGPDSGSTRAFRGGSWHYGARDCRVSVAATARRGFGTAMLVSDSLRPPQ